ncbi:hypothetical protein ABB37_09002 [Leptomonas pyrrhocoris]|uniref:Uncharacterized protein n=1 Tax=Leptomonas pyrrhocoris TaxID=157538 RepID=A0A0M9FRP0_LEPPY|nr:hypothetical protein ABB37_09002 [Leptomonas pyrrhocoris]KPA74675.1 hypothetical protein ABB37_09002 [Leptomonas pyrrhocoris]|eukprot:XP_015653114.1 hypothetical protein ABB37_09002 [Leptomonas pyrrhocoris]
MLRLLSLQRISSKQFTHGPFATHSRKQSFRESKASLQVSRRRAQSQQANFELQQSVNEQFGSRQRRYGHERRCMQHAAEDLMYGRAQRAARRDGQAGQSYTTAKDRAAEMATARQLLQLQESTRRLMKKGKTSRTESFRALKRWSR